jgi:ATP-dependent Lon protease
MLKGADIMEVFALFSDKTAEKILLDSFPARETEEGLILKTTISSPELKKSAVTSINNAYILLEKLFDNIPERIGICVYGFSSNVTGNSADIAFALALFSHVTKKGIIKPSKPLPLSVAATGSITERLSIECVGHIREKFLAAARNKIDTVLYPSGNQNEIDRGAHV